MGVRTFGKAEPRGPKVLLGKGKETRFLNVKSRERRWSGTRPVQDQVQVLVQVLVLDWPTAVTVPPGGLSVSRPA